MVLPPRVGLFFFFCLGVVMLLKKETGGLHGLSLFTNLRDVHTQPLPQLLIPVAQTRPGGGRELLSSNE